MKEVVKTLCSNPNFRTHKLKNELENHETMRKQIRFLDLLHNTSKELLGKLKSQIDFGKEMGIRFWS